MHISCAFISGAYTKKGFPVLTHISFFHATQRIPSNLSIQILQTKIKPNKNLFLNKMQDYPIISTDCLFQISVGISYYTKCNTQAFHINKFYNKIFN